MGKRAQYFGDLFENARTRARARWVKVGGAVGLALLAIRLFLEEQVVSAAQWLWPRLQFLARQDIGVIGLAAVAILLTVVLAVIVLGYLDSRPKTEAKETESTPVPLTKEERELIQPIRTAWRLSGEHTTFALQSLFNDVIYPLKEQRYWGKLLQPSVDELESARTAISAAVTQDSQVPPKDVIDAFNRMYNAYANVMRWLADVDEKGDVLLDNKARYQDRLADWMDLHYAFQDELARVYQIPELHGRLTIFTHKMQMEYPALAQLMRRIHERSTRRRMDRLSLVGDVTPSTPDNQAYPHQSAEEEGHGR